MGMKTIESFLHDEEKFRLLFEKSNDPILLIDEYNFVDCNNATLNLLDYSDKSELKNIRPSEISPEYQPDGRNSGNKAIEMMDIAYKEGYNRFEWVHLNKRGEELFIDVALTRIPHQGKDMLFTIWRDVTTQKKYEEDLKQREYQFSTLFEQAADGILVGIKGGEIIQANESMCSLTHYSKNELIGQNISILFEQNELESTPLRYDLVKKGDTVIRERNIIRKDGTRLPIEMNTKILDDGRMQALFRDLSKRKKAEADAELSKQQLEKAEKIAGLGRYYYKIKDDQWESSAILNQLFGISQDYKKNFKSWVEIVHPDFRTEMKEYFLEEVIKQKKHFDKVYKIKRINDGVIRWVHGFGDVEYNEQDEAVLMVGTIQDITRQKEAEIALQESEEKYRNIFLNSPLGIFHYNLNGIITDCNKHFVDIIGSSKKALVGLHMFTQLNNAEIIEAVKKSLIQGEAYYEDWYTSVTGNKSTFVRILFKGITDSNDKIISGTGLVEDITDRRKAELELIQSEEKFKSIATLLPEVVFEIDLAGNLTFANLKAFEIFEYTQEDFQKGLNVFQMLDPAEIERAKYNMRNLPHNKTNVGEKYIALTKSGKRFPILIYSDYIIKDRKVEGLRGIIVNISELEKTQEQLRKSEEKFRNIYNSSSDIIMIITKEGRVLNVNESVEKQLGYHVDEFIGKNITDFISTVDIEEVDYRMEMMFNGNKVPIREMKMLAADNREIPVEVNSKIVDYNGKKCILSQIRNIKERKDLEQRIYETMIETEEKERQRLASDIHDEIGPLLSSLKMYIESLNETNDTDKQRFIKEKLQILVKESITNVREVSNALSPYLLRKYGLKVAIKAFFEAQKDLISIDFKITFNKERFPINTETVFYRIIKELFNNTIKHADAKTIKLLLSYTDGKLFLRYEDDGKGIDQSDLINIDKKGMGLLNITNRIKSINGSYKFFTNSKKGFKLEVFKPTETI